MIAHIKKYKQINVTKHVYIWRDREITHLVIAPLNKPRIEIIEKSASQFPRENRVQTKIYGDEGKNQ